jgi:hypothetical protein
MNCEQSFLLSGDVQKGIFFPCHCKNVQFASKCNAASQHRTYAHLPPSSRTEARTCSNQNLIISSWRRFLYTTAPLIHNPEYQTTSHLWLWHDISSTKREKNNPIIHGWRMDLVSPYLPPFLTPYSRNPSAANQRRSVTWNSVSTGYGKGDHAQSSMFSSWYLEDPLEAKRYLRSKSLSKTQVY